MSPRLRIGLLASLVATAGLGGGLWLATWSEFDADELKAIGAAQAELRRRGIWREELDLEPTRRHRWWRVYAFDGIEMYSIVLDERYEVVEVVGQS